MMHKWCIMMIVFISMGNFTFGKDLRSQRRLTGVWQAIRSDENECDRSRELLVFYEAKGRKYLLLNFLLESPIRDNIFYDWRSDQFSIKSGLNTTAPILIGRMIDQNTFELQAKIYAFPENQDMSIPEWKRGAVFHKCPNIQTKDFSEILQSLIK